MTSIRRWFSFMVLAVAPTLAWSAVHKPEQMAPTLEERHATEIITRWIASMHYRKVPLDAKLSSMVLDNYLKALDPNRSFFLADDIKRFEIYRSRLDKALRFAHLDPAFAIFDTYRTRVKERADYAQQLLKQTLDFTVNEDYMFDRSESPWATTKDELNDIWRKRVKNDILNLRLAGKQKPEEVQGTLSKRYQRLVTSTNQLHSSDVFQLFINAYTAAIDPHTDYFTPRASENFEIRMSLSLEGIGAVLQSDNDYTVVKSLVPGGPADQSKQLHPDDRITGVGEGDSGEVTDVIGWRLDDVVERIRGPKGTHVRLQVLPKSVGPEGPYRTVAITRDKVTLEEQAAKKSIQEVKSNGITRRIGVIDVPSFYMDFAARARGDKDFRSTTRDVRKLLKELQTDHVDGVVIDLRGNGGGSLTEATQLTGLFIDNGPVVQVRDADGRIEVFRDPDDGIAYSGPLAVLVDRFSASASEIFTGAIQDYHRGIIIGEPTFGKGTVQKLIDLDSYADPGEPPLGELKATIAQFFRVSGDSTQHRGITPDIVYPTAQESNDSGERSLPNALPWDHIAQAKHFVYSDYAGLLDKVRDMHQSRIKSDPGFAYLEDALAVARKTKDKKSITLLESRRMEERAQNEKDELDRENRLRKARGLEALTELPKAKLDSDGLETLDDDEDGKDKSKDALGDVLLTESANILSDLITEQHTAAALRAAPTASTP